MPQSSSDLPGKTVATLLRPAIPKRGPQPDGQEMGSQKNIGGMDYVYREGREEKKTQPCVAFPPHKLEGEGDAKVMGEMRTEPRH